MEGPDTPQPNTLESLFSVPIEIVFRQTNGKPLLTRAEARCLLRITMLAAELDELAKVSVLGLDQRKKCRSFGQKLLAPAPKTHPFLRPLLPLLCLQGHVLTNQALETAHNELHRVFVDLAACSRSLRQCSEHNWTLSESLLDTLGEDFTDIQTNSENLPKGAVLAVEKRRLSDLEEELCNRIDSLTGQQSEEDDTSANDEEEGGEDETEQEGRKKKGMDLQGLTMARVCTLLWNGQSIAPSSDERDNDNDDVSGKHKSDSTQPSQKVGLFSYPETIQGLDQSLMKENKPPAPALECTPMAVDDQSKPQGIPHYSADMEEDDDDDATVGEDNDEKMEDSNNNSNTNNSNSQRSQHSVVSNNSQEAMPKKKKKRPPTQSQMLVGEALTMLAFQE